MGLLLTRRSMLRGAASMTAAWGMLGGRGWAQQSAIEQQPLRIPELIDARAHGNAISLRAQAGQTVFFPGRPSDTLGFNGSYLGPTIRLHRGDNVRVEVANDLKRDTSVHWHGLLIPATEDGGPHQAIRPGMSWRADLAVRQPAATLLYHAHVHNLTAEQVYAGLAGLMVITDEDEQRLGLPSEYGVDDLPILIQDRLFEDGRMVLPGGMAAVMQGRRGDTILVNGTADAVARVPARLVRLRLANGANARIFDLAFDDGRPFHWIASDGGLLERPVELRRLWLAPGERAEILVDFADAEPVALRTGQDANLAMMMGMAPPGAARQGAYPPVISFEPQGQGDGTAVLPPALIVRERVDPARAARRRRFVLNMGMGGMPGMMGGGMMGGAGMQGGMGGPGVHGMAGGPAMPGVMGSPGVQGGMAPVHGINGRPFDMKRIDERVPLGDVEIWEVAGDMLAHPFHVHGVQFEVLRRNGAPATVRDQGLRDTVLVREPTELLVHFTQPAPEKPFMYHCHVLEHEDNGMMGQFLTV